MNPTPCPLCNALFERKRLAFIRSEWREFERLQNELDAHKVICEVINSQWYRCLWPSAVVIEQEPK